MCLDVLGNNPFIVSMMTGWLPYFMTEITSRLKTLTIHVVLLNLAARSGFVGMTGILVIFCHCSKHANRFSNEVKAVAIPYISVELCSFDCAEPFLHRASFSLFELINKISFSDEYRLKDEDYYDCGQEVTALEFVQREIFEVLLAYFSSVEATRVGTLDEAANRLVTDAKVGNPMKRFTR
jgi:hypothetical protein